MRRHIASTFGGAICGARRQAHEISTRYRFQLMHTSCSHKLEIQCDREGLRPLGVQLLPYPMLVGGTTCPFRERNMLGGRVLLPVLPHILAFSFFSQPSLFPPPFAPPLATRSWPSRTRTGGARTVRAAHEPPALGFDSVLPSSRGADTVPARPGPGTRACARHARHAAHAPVVCSAEAHPGPGSVHTVR